MTKSIESLMKKISNNEDGTLKGGFMSIRGGLLSLPSTNTENCTNRTCGGTNEVVCTNTYDCSESTNKSTKCDNQNTCFSL